MNINYESDLCCENIDWSQSSDIVHVLIDIIDGLAIGLFQAQLDAWRRTQQQKPRGIPSIGCDEFQNGFVEAVKGGIPDGITPANWCSLQISESIAYAIKYKIDSKPLEDVVYWIKFFFAGEYSHFILDDGENMYRVASSGGWWDPAARFVLKGRIWRTGLIDHIATKGEVVPQKIRFRLDKIIKSINKDETYQMPQDLLVSMIKGALDRANSTPSEVKNEPLPSSNTREKDGYSTAKQLAAEFNVKLNTMIGSLNRIRCLNENARIECTRDNDHSTSKNKYIWAREIVIPHLERVYCKNIPKT